MRYVLIPAVVLCAVAAQALPQTPQAAPARKIPCKTAANVSMCYWTHGRLSFANGAPSYRIWKVGTKRILGVYSGPSRYPPSTDNDSELPEFPANIDAAYAAEYGRRARVHDPEQVPSPIYADFEVCPLEPEKRGEMRAVCIESARKIVLEKDEPKRR